MNRRTPAEISGNRTSKVTVEVTRDEIEKLREGKRDGFAAVQLIQQNKALDFDSLRHMAEQVEGPFLLFILFSN